MFGIGKTKNVGELIAELQKLEPHFPVCGTNAAGIDGMCSNVDVVRADSDHFCVDEGTLYVAISFWGNPIKKVN